MRYALVLSEKSDWGLRIEQFGYQSLIPNANKFKTSLIEEQLNWI